MAAVDPYIYDRLPQPVRKRGPGGDHRAVPDRNGCEHSGGGGVLQGDGPEAEGENSVTKCGLKGIIEISETLKQAIENERRLIWKN